jgi:hypothetical protein
VAGLRFPIQRSIYEGLPERLTNRWSQTLARHDGQFESMKRIVEVAKVRCLSRAHSRAYAWHTVE